MNEAQLTELGWTLAIFIGLRVFGLGMGARHGKIGYV